MQLKGVAVAAYTVAVLGLFRHLVANIYDTNVFIVSCDFSHQRVAHAFEYYWRHQTRNSYLVSLSSDNICDSRKTWLTQQLSISIGITGLVVLGGNTQLKTRLSISKMHFPAALRQQYTEQLMR